MKRSCPVEEGTTRSKPNQRAGSESCAGRGRLRVRSVDSERTGRMYEAPKSAIDVGAEAVEAAEGSNRTLVKVRGSEPTGVVDGGTSAQGHARNLGDPRVSALGKGPGVDSREIKVQADRSGDERRAERRTESSRGR